MSHVASLPPDGPEGDLIGIVLASLFILLYVVIIPGLVMASTNLADLLT